MSQLVVHTTIIIFLNRPNYKPIRIASTAEFVLIPIWHVLRGFAKLKKIPKIKKKLVGGSRSHLDKKKLENRSKIKFCASVQFAPAWRCTWRLKVFMHAAFHPVFCDFVIVLRFG